MVSKTWIRQKNKFRVYSLRKENVFPDFFFLKREGSHTLVACALLTNEEPPKKKKFH